MMTNKSIRDIASPTFVVNLNQVIENIRSFKIKFLQQNIIFRPHFKTHQNSAVAKIFYDEGIRNIAVSNLDMVEEFASFNWEDVTLAFTINRREIKRLQHLSTSNKLNIVTEDLDTLQFLEKNFDGTLGVFIKIDTGYNRTGIAWNNWARINEILRFIDSSNNLKIKGLLSHFGNTYHATSVDEIKQLYYQGVERLTQLRIQIDDKYSEIPISVGDTPSASIIKDFGAIDEFRPGNFVYYDWMQFKLGVCSVNKIASFMVCPIVAKHKSRNQIVIHGGAVHFSKEYILQNGERNYGQLAILDENEKLAIVEDSFIVSLSQEHGIVQCSDASFNKYEIGDLMILIPIHSCLSANLMKGKTVVI